MKTFEAAIFYNSVNINEVKQIYDYLINDHFTVFIDTEEILAGQSHLEIVNDILKTTPVLLICIGEEGLGLYQRKEMWASINSTVTQNGKIVIPVILPGGNINHNDVPVVLTSIDAVIFEKTIDEAKPLQRLTDGIMQAPLSKMKINFERPISVHEYDELLKRTISAYNTKESAEKFYESWRDNIPGEQIEFFQRHLPSKARILDAGCGPGHHSAVFKSSNHQVTGIDLSKESLNLAKKIDQSLEFRHMDMRKMSFSRNQFDAIWACASVVHTAKEFMDTQLREFKRVVKPRGIISLTLSVGKKPAVEPDGRFFESFESTNEFINFLSNTGFELVDCISTSTTKTTLGGNRLAKWTTFICEAIPENTMISSY